MTNDQLIGLLCGDVICYDEAGVACKIHPEDRNHIVELLKKEEKYRWYDLQQDPTDLPKVEQEILVVLDGKVGRITYDYAVEMVYWINDGKFYDSRTKNSMVIAWKHIEQF